MCRETNRPLPAFSDDDVLDFIVTEAVLHNFNETSKKAVEEAEEDDARDAFRGKEGREAWLAEVNGMI